MNIKKLFLSSLLVLSAFSFTSCNTGSGNSGEVEPAAATIKISSFEHGTATTSLDENESLKEGDQGIITITPENKNYRVDSVYQNYYFKLFPVDGDNYSYNFTLSKGENTFDIEMYFEEILESDSEIIAPENEIISKDGTISDEVDPIPVSGQEIEVPDYDNPVTIYFKDAPWWCQYAPGTSIKVFDENDNVISSNKEYGDLMTWMSYNSAGSFNYWKAIVDGDKASKVQFFRMDGLGYTYWGARTDVLPMPTGENDMYILNDVAAWYNPDEGNTDFASATAGKYDPSKDPVIVDLGIYEIYFETNSWWNEQSGSSTPYIYCWGEQNMSWPGVLMEKVSNNLYKFDFDTSKYLNCIFDKGNGNYQTTDLKVPLTYGSNAKVIAKLPDTYLDKCSVTWEEYKG